MRPFPDDLPNRSSPRDHLDETRIIVRLASSLIPGPDQLTAGLYCAWGGPLSVSLEDASRYSSAVAWDPERGLFESFVSNQRFTQFEWGASGTALEFVLEVVNSVAVETAMVGLGYAVAKIRGRQGRGTIELPTTPTDFAADAARATAAIFDLRIDDLEVVEVRIDRRTASVRLKTTGENFTATAAQPDSGDPFFVVRRD